LRGAAYHDPELSDSAELAADVLRAIAKRWRLRLQAGRLGPHPMEETVRLVSAIESALQALGAGAATATASPLPRQSSDDERFRCLVEHVRDYAIFLLTPEGEIASWNSGAERIEGYRPEEVIGRHFAMFHTPEDVEGGKPQRELELAGRDGRYSEEGWRVRKGGERFWANVTMTALRDADGRLTGYAKVVRDVTDLRHTTEALRQSEERMRLMVEAVRDYAIFMLDPEGHVASWNVGAERLKGYRSDEIVGQHFSIFYPEEERRRGHPADELRRAKADGRYEEEGWRIRKDGSRFWANVVITAVFDEEGRHLGFTKVTRDFTETKRLREAQLAIQLRDDFLSVAGHELRTPLTALLMQVQSLVRSSDGGDARLKQRLERAAAAGQRLELLIGQMLDVSRITAGQLRLDREPTRLDVLVREVVERFSDLAADSQCAIGLRLDAVEGVWDPMRTEQVLTNLISNAIKYGKGHPIDIETHTEGGEAVLRIVDRGIGIAPADQKNIFERFARAAGAREYAGFGLGLWISRQIVAASGGQIDVQSEPGRGATFTVTLPLQPREQDVAHPRP
jgi:PAS domain S-box-containing protein